MPEDKPCVTPIAHIGTRRRRPSTRVEAAVSSEEKNCGLNRADARFATTPGLAGVDGGVLLDEEAHGARQAGREAARRHDAHLQNGVVRKMQIGKRKF